MSTTNMSKIRVLVLLSLSALLGPAAAVAQSPNQFRVPFGFTVGSRSFAAGSYLVSEEAPMVIRLRASNGHGGVMVNTNAAAPAKEPNRAILTFRRYGDRYFLSSVSDPDRGWKLPTGAEEKRS